MPFVIQGVSRGQTVYWRKWTGASVSGRPKWVDRLSLKCLYSNREIAERTAAGDGSKHFTTSLFVRDEVVPVTDVVVQEVSELPT